MLHKIGESAIELLQLIYYLGNQSRGAFSMPKLTNYKENT